MKKFINYMSKSFKDDQVTIYSAQASFFIIVSALPFLALIITILGTLSDSLVERMENFILTVVPESLHSAVEFVLREVQSASHFGIISITAIGAIWASCKGIGAICSGIGKIFSRDEHSFFAFKISRRIGQTFIFLIVMVGTLIAFSITEFLLNFSKNNIIFLSLFAEIILRLRAVIFFVVLCLFFCLLYYRLSGKQGKFYQHIFGATFTSIGFIGFTFFYSIYISYSMKKSYLYAGFGALIFLMLWLYFCIMIIMIGAIINRYLFYIDFFAKKDYNKKNNKNKKAKTKK